MSQPKNFKQKRQDSSIFCEDEYCLHCQKASKTPDINLIENNIQAKVSEKQWKPLQVNKNK